MSEALPTVSGAPLSKYTTLELGGPARYLVEARDEATVVAALKWAEVRGLAVTVLGGGSNVVIADSGFDGLVIRMAQRGIVVEDEGELVAVQAAAGESWDALVEHTVQLGLWGLERLSGIPGTVGAVPVQNVGAYGDEVARKLRSLWVLDRQTLATELWPSHRCAFAYRHSIFKESPERWVVLRVTFALRRQAVMTETARHAELEARLAVDAATPSPLQVRAAVMELRRGKSMLLEADDDNRRSVGSFFLNPVVDAAIWTRLANANPPAWQQPDGRYKLSAAWLIEQSGVSKGTRRAQVGVSSRHALALVHHGGGSTAELVELARWVQQRVRQRFGVELQPEPRFLGFERHPLRKGRV